MPIIQIYIDDITYNKFSCDDNKEEFKKHLQLIIKEKYNIK